MNICFDGLSGVGKTYYGELFAKKHGLTFLSLLPDLNDVDEYALHLQMVGRQSSHHSSMLLEGSIIMSEVVKNWMYMTNYISIEELLQMFSVSQNSVQTYGIIYFIDEYENIKAKRKKRGRKFEYAPDIGDLPSLDKYIEITYLQHAKKRGINVVVCNVCNKSDEEVLKEIEKAIYTLLN